MATLPDTIDLSNFLYSLPDSQIAKFPVSPRDHSKLLVYQNGRLTHRIFKELDQVLPPNSLLIGNETKVIPARILLERATGAKIELFLLEPHQHSGALETFMNQNETATWQCMVGNQKKWKEGEVLRAELLVGNKSTQISAQFLSRGNPAVVKLTWTQNVALNELIEAWGTLPIPPYLNRATEDTDKENYQTVYAQTPGAVAAPTAGLHFTPEVFAALNKQNIQFKTLNLHVGAGTFQPVKAQNVLQHKMHYERFEVSTQLLQDLISNPIRYAVGTTSLRTLESLYWMGIKLQRGATDFNEVHKEEVFEFLREEKELPSYEVALTAVLEKLRKEGKEKITGQTGIMIVPGYPIQSINGLITNFHQPGSTLLLLIAAIVGDEWNKIYQTALDKNYRFLSYGDSSVLEVLK